MKSRRFFSTLWRVNALLIFAIGAVGLIALLAGVAFAVSEMTRTRHVDSVVNIEDKQADLGGTSFGNFEPVVGGALMRAPLHLEQEYQHVTYAKGTRSVQNYLFVDSRSHLSYWLVPGYRGLILDATDLPTTSYNEEKTPVVAVLYQLVDKDSDKDERLSDSDLKTIAVSAPDGRKFVRLLDNVESFNRAHLITPTTLLVMYKAGGKLHAADIDLQAGKVVRDTVLVPAS